MSDSASILKEYLISVGVKSDEGSLSKFQNILGSIEKLTISLTGAMAAGIGAIEGLVTVTTHELDDLYWATKRLKSSASDIQDFQLRMAKAGTSATDARAMLESLAAFRRTNPLGDSFLGMIGVDSRGKGEAEVLDQLINRFKQLNAQGKFGYVIAAKWGETLGFTEQQVWSMVHTSSEAENVYANMYRKLGINQTQAKQNAHDYQNKLKDLNAEFTVVSQTLGLKFLPLADKFLTWLMTSPAAANMGNALLGIATDVADLAEGAANLFNAMPKEAQEFGIIGFFLFGKKGVIAMTAIGAVASLLDRMSGDTGKGRPELTNDAGTSQRPDRVIARWNYDHGLGFLNSNDFNTTYAMYKAQQQQAGKTDTPSGPLPQGRSPQNPPQDLPTSGPLGVRSNNPGNLQPGGHEAVYATPEEGMGAMARLLTRYSRQGMTTITDIINKYAPPNANNTAAYINRVAREMGMSATAPLRMNDPEVMRKLMTAMIRVEQGYVPYGSGMIGDAVRAALGTPGQTQSKATSAASPGLSLPGGGGSSPFSGTARLGDLQPSKNITISQGDTTVTIHGAKDPKATGDQVKKVADRRQGDLIRNMSPILT